MRPTAGKTSGPRDPGMIAKKAVRATWIHVCRQTFTELDGQAKPVLRYYYLSLLLTVADESPV
jgi:hypothetical protein